MAMAAAANGADRKSVVDGKETGVQTCALPIYLHISRRLETTRAAISEIRPTRADRARPRLFALLVGGAVACASLVATASVNSADARPGYGGGHGHGGHGYGGGNWSGGHRAGGHGAGPGYGRGQTPPSGR